MQPLIVLVLLGVIGSWKECRIIYVHSKMSHVQGISLGMSEKSIGSCGRALLAILTNHNFHIA